MCLMIRGCWFCGWGYWRGSGGRLIWLFCVMRLVFLVWRGVGDIFRFLVWVCWCWLRICCRCSLRCISLCSCLKGVVWSWMWICCCIWFIRSFIGCSKGGGRKWCMSDEDDEGIERVRILGWREGVKDWEELFWGGRILSFVIFCEYDIFFCF